MVSVFPLLPSPIVLFYPSVVKVLLSLCFVPFAFWSVLKSEMIPVSSLLFFSGVLLYQILLWLLYLQLCIDQDNTYCCSAFGVMHMHVLFPTSTTNPCVVVMVEAVMCTICLGENVHALLRTKAI